MRTFILFLIAVFVISYNSHAQLIGAVQKYKKNGNSLSITTKTNTNVEVDFWQQGIARVRIYQTQKPDMLQNYLITGAPQNPATKLKTDDETITIGTDSLRLEINKATTALTFKNAQGGVLFGSVKTRPVFLEGNAISLVNELPAEEKIIGLGEKVFSTNRRGRKYKLWVEEHYKYDWNTDPLYINIPFYIGVLNNRCYGFFLHTSYESTFNMGAQGIDQSVIRIKDNAMDFFVIQGADVATVVSKYTELTGRSPMLPLWAFGYQQCRYSYYPDAQLLNIARTFRKRKIPCDVLHIDMHYMENEAMFTWDNKLFPDPAGLDKQLEAMGYKSVINLKCKLKVPAQIAEAEKKGYLATYPDGQPVQQGDGRTIFDFTNAKARKWWGQQMQVYTNAGIDGYWNDANEVSTEKGFPIMMQYDYEGQGANHRKVYNLTGSLNAMATYEGEKNFGGAISGCLTLRAAGHRACNVMPAPGPAM